MLERNNQTTEPVEDASRKESDIKSQHNVVTTVKILVLAAVVTVALGYFAAASRAQLSGQKSQDFDRQISENAHQMMEQGKQIFRYDTFGDEV